MKKTYYRLRYLLLVLSLVILSIGAIYAPCIAQDILRSRLENGLRVIIVKDPIAPVVTTQITYLVGSNEVPKGFPGTAHALEHMMFRGSNGLSAEQLAAITAAMGGNSNASTSQLTTQYYFTVPSDLLELPLRIEAIRMKDVISSQELWKKERGAIEQEVARDISNPMYRLYTRILERMFRGTPYAHDALGTISSFEKTTGEMLKRFHDRWYVPNNALLVVTGDVNPEKTIALIRSIFGKIDPRPIPDRPKIDLKPLKSSVIEMGSNLPYGLALVAYRMPGYKDKEFAAATIMADVLNNERGNLYKLVVDGKVLFSGFDYTPFRETGIGFAYAGFPRGKDGKETVRLLKEVITGYLNTGFPRELVKAAKRREIAEAEFRKNSIPGLASEWSRAIAVEGRTSPDDDISAIKEVLPKDVDRTARKFLNVSITGLLKPGHSPRPISWKGFTGKESFTKENPSPVELPPWAKKRLSHVPVPRSKLSPVVTILPNGLRLIFQKEDITPTVTLRGKIRHDPGMQEPLGMEGITDVLNDLFQYGTDRRDRISFKKAVDDIGANLSAGTSFSLECLSIHFDKGMELLAEDMLRPRLPGKAFKTVQKETMDALRGKLKSPAYIARYGLLSMLYPKGDPRLRQATPETVASITLNDVRRFYKKTFRPDLTTIVIIGDISHEQALKAVKKYFGTWKVVGPKPKTTPPPVPPSKAGFLYVPDSDRVQDRVILAETVGATRTHRDYYPLQLGLHVLSGGFYATRLYRDLRKNTGLVYSVGAFLDAKRTRAVFGVAYGCDPGNVSKASAIILKDIKDMQTRPVSMEEIKQAKTMLIRQVPLAESSIDGSCGLLLDFAYQGLPLDEHVQAAWLYRKMTPGEVQSAFSKWIRPDDFCKVVRGPKPVLD